MPNFIKTEWKSDSDSHLDLEKIEAKIDHELESGSDYDSVYELTFLFARMITNENDSRK